MARKGRETSPLGIYHIILRGNDKLFLCENDYKEFLLLLKKYFSGENQVYAYSLNVTKIHLVIYTQNAVSTVLKPLCTSYARYINRTHKKNGKLFYDRFISIPLADTAGLTLAVRYTAKIPSQLTSLSEYKKKDGICSVGPLSEKIPIKKIVASGAALPANDDYTSMTDDEIKNLLLSLYGTAPASGEKFTKYLCDAVESSNLSMARLSRIFGFKPIYKKTGKKGSAKAKRTKSGKPESTQTDSSEHPKQEAPRKKQELNLWLL